MTRRVALTWFLLIAAIGLGLRLLNLTARSLWFDESFSWRLIQFPWGELVARTAADVHPPLYYSVLKVWTLIFGQSLLALRSLSLTLFTGCLTLVYGFTAYAFQSRRAGVFAATLLALSAWQIPFASETRMYMLGSLFTVLSTWLLLKATREGSPAAWLGYVLSAAAFLYTHNFALLTLTAHGVFMAGSILARTRGHVGEILSEKLTWFSLGSIAAIILLYVPWLPTLIRQANQVGGSFWVPALTRWSIPDTFVHFFWPTSEPLPHLGPALAVTLLPLLATIGLIVWLLLMRRERDGAFLAALCLTIPILGASLISLVGQSLYQERFLVFAHVWLPVTVGTVVSRSRPNRLAWGIFAVLVLASVVSLIPYQRERKVSQRPGVGAALAHVNQDREVGEPIFVTSSFIFLPVAFYEGSAIGAESAPKLVSETKDLAHFAGGPVILPEEIVSSQAVQNSPATSFWLIDTTGFGGSETETVAGRRRRQRLAYPEVFPYQGEIIVSRWE